MFNRVAASAFEVTSAAVIPCGSADIRGNKPIVWRVKLVAFKDYGFLRGIARGCGEFLIGARAVVAHHTVNPLFAGEVKILVFPAIADVTGRAARFVSRDGNAEVVKGNSALAMFFFWVFRMNPGPVDSFMNLFRRFCMTA